MPLAATVEALIDMLGESSLGDFALDLRAYLEEGLPIEGGRGARDGLDGEDDPPRRRRSASEQIDGAIEFLKDQLVQPYLLVEEAEKIAGGLGQPEDGPKPLMLIDMRFENARPYPAVSDGERRAIEKVRALLPHFHEAMLMRAERSADGE